MDTLLCCIFKYILKITRNNYADTPNICPGGLTFDEFAWTNPKANDRFVCWVDYINQPKVSQGQDSNLVGEVPQSETDASGDVDKQPQMNDDEIEASNGLEKDFNIDDDGNELSKRTSRFQQD